MNLAYLVCIFSGLITGLLAGFFLGYWYAEKHFCSAFLQGVKCTLDKAVEKTENHELEWTTFFFDAGFDWGVISTKERWTELVKRAKKANVDLTRLLNAANVPNLAKDLMPKFGLTQQCSGKLTLAKWALENNMDLTV